MIVNVHYDIIMYLVKKGLIKERASKHNENGRYL